MYHGSHAPSLVTRCLFTYQRQCDLGSQVVVVLVVDPCSLEPAPPQYKVPLISLPACFHLATYMEQTGHIARPSCMWFLMKGMRTYKHVFPRSIRLFLIKSK